MANHLSGLQTELQSIYDIVIPYDVAQFVTTDAQWARTFDTSTNPRDIPEKLLLQQDEDNLDVALYLDHALVEALRVDNPLTCLSESNLVRFWTALEGVSHFLYLVWNVHYGRGISLFELELQAEIDKFVCAVALCVKQAPRYSLDSIHARLFDAARYDPALTAEELVRYRSANSLAAKYCKRIVDSLANHANSHTVTQDLRRFYRLTHHHKVDYINHAR